mmetsp:Transcript_755/g.1212  ORF Transcript_755/g.1212 Transcript_755/m.1212 type:complete len:333 (-) Transcript_755:473-1471(-)
MIRLLVVSTTRTTTRTNYTRRPALHCIQAPGLSTISSRTCACACPTMITRNKNTWQNRVNTISNTIIKKSKPRLRSPGGNHDIITERASITPYLFTRIPAYILLLFVLNHEEYSPIPFTFDFMAGPSMLPTIYPTGECYLRVKWWFLSLLGLGLGHGNGHKWERGDIIVFKDIRGNNACKRIIGVEGNAIDRLGEYVHLYHDESDNGVRKVPFDFGDWERQLQLDKTSACTGTGTGTDGIGKEKVVIPKGKIWVEGDNPLYSVDSRHYGPISTDNILGRVSYRVWPRRRPRTEASQDSCIIKNAKSSTRPKPLTDDEMYSGQYNITKVPYAK